MRKARLESGKHVDNLGNAVDWPPKGAVYAWTDGDTSYAYMPEERHLVPSFDIPVSDGVRSLSSLAQALASPDALFSCLADIVEDFNTALVSAGQSPIAALSERINTGGTP